MFNCAVTWFLSSLCLCVVVLSTSLIMDCHKTVFTWVIYTWQWSTANLKAKLCFSYLCFVDTLSSPRCSSASVLVHSQLIFISLGWTPTERQVCASAGEGGLGRGLAWSPAASSSAETGWGEGEGKSVLVWQLNFLSRTSQTESKRSPHGNLTIWLLCDVSRETDTGGKMCPVGASSRANEMEHLPDTHLCRVCQWTSSALCALPSSTPINLQLGHTSWTRLVLLSVHRWLVYVILQQGEVGRCNILYSRSGGGRNHTETESIISSGELWIESMDSVQEHFSHEIRTFNCSKKERPEIFKIAPIEML